MVEKYEHLQLPYFPEELVRKKRKVGGHSFYNKSDRDKNKFYDAEIQNFNTLKENLKDQKRKFGKFFDPNLIYKISVNQKVDENDFREQLKKFDVKVIAPSPDKSGYWIVFSEDGELKKFEHELHKYTIEEKKYGIVFDAIKEIKDIPPEEKIGPLLKEIPFKNGESSPLDFSIWMMDSEHLAKFLEGFRQYIVANKGIILDEFSTSNFYKLKIRVNKKLLEEILYIKEIETVDRPPRIRLQEKIQVGIDEFPPIGKPKENAPGILIIDSGITTNQPLLKDSIGDAIAIATRDPRKLSSENPYDEIGHGTRVAGVALYGDVQKCIDDKKFSPEFWIFSSKIMYINDEGNPSYDVDELFEHQLYKAVTRITENYTQCKIINLSFGSLENRMYTGRRQFDIASLIDELAYQRELMFVISSGNYYNFNRHDYPNYLINDTGDELKIVDTASSALGITVGALSEEPVPGTFKYIFQPSHYTRVGPGYKGMIKPDFVEIGGGIDSSTQIITTNHSYIEDHRLFCLETGTSFSAPKIAYYLAKIVQKYPTYSNNLIKTLLLSSASIPEERPGILNNSDNQKKLLNVYGYGKPDLEKAFFSDKNRVLLIKDSTIKPNKIHIYPFYVPKAFVYEKGSRKISVSLCYDPITDKNRIEYYGVAFETHLFKNLEPEMIKEAYSKTDLENTSDEIVPQQIRSEEIKLIPGQNLRKKGTLQKGVKKIERNPTINTDLPLTLVVICQNRWVDEDYLQNYSVVVTIEHKMSIDIYTQIQLRNRERAEITL
jgi:hypothetical protein